ncbi:hypothetical protein BLD48_05810 [Exiguobacterium sp. KRL4]|uniref:hypothetical protein n=1 Tax=Exiguobacterium sp. KRL4 TaxID=1914536 RepID=UPI0008F9276E|nr:hypothetical protein [Exiguobacterium sp. KRL4]OIN67404.1 hypothetical protein BLD48_05810 [Exiguobacterium sp. KRL4]
MQIAILKCKKDFILNGGPAKDPLFAKVDDIVIGAYIEKKNEVLTLVEGKHACFIELDKPNGYDHFDLEAVIPENTLADLRKVYAERRKYS